jgi:hypothetical protein
MVSKNGDKIEVVKVLILAVVSFVLGFALVILFLRPSSSSSEDRAKGSPPAAAPVSRSYADPSLSGEGYAPRGKVTNREKSDHSQQGTALPDVPPGKTPEKVAIDGEAYYLKCWDENGTAVKGDECGRLSVFEKRFSTRLYVIDRCKKKHSGDKAEGKLSLGTEIDFETMSLSFWNGASSTIKDAPLVASCLRSELAGLSLEGFGHRFAKYRFFFTVLFGKEAIKAKKKNQPATASAADLRKGKLVEVIKDHVRVRKEPVTGKVFGKISRGNQVRLLAEKDGWCQVVTPNNNKGWMICDSLQK